MAAAALVSRGVLWSARWVCRTGNPRLQTSLRYSLPAAASVVHPNKSAPLSRAYTSEPEKGYNYLTSHEWAKIDGNTATIGISDYAQEKLGDVVFVELPEVDSEVTKEDAFCVLESVKAAVDVHSPLSGTVTEVNTELSENPGQLNKDPYGNGWIVKLEMSDSSECDQLLSPEDYKEFLEESI